MPQFGMNGTQKLDSHSVHDGDLRKPAQIDLDSMKDGRFQS